MPEQSNNPPSMPLSTPEPMKADVPPTRKRLIVSGNVQEAGYRVFIKSIARSMGIVGFVRNLPDETVEVVCEGEPKTIERFLKAIDRKGDVTSPMDINVVSMEETPAQTEGEFKQFTIVYNGTLTQEERENNREDREERMILGASMLGQKIDCVGQKTDGLGQKMDGLGQKMDCVGQKVDGVGKAVEGVGQKVDSMHSDMNKRFDHMAQRYDLIATSLVKAIDRMDQGFERMDRNFERSRKETAAELKRSRAETGRTGKDIAASNRELAGAVKFMIKKLSDKPARRQPSMKRKR